MAAGDSYRAMAQEFQAKADSNPSVREEYEKLAKAYLHLAEQADRNAMTIEFELPPSDSSDGTRH